MTRLLLSLPFVIHIACGGPRATTTPTDAVTISIIGTNDVHGHMESLAVFGGYVNNLRAVRAAEGGAVLLLDGGDMFQGTLESNLVEGRAMIAAYNLLGYTAATVGNHEFDYGPVGDAATPENRDQDPRGALKARAAEANFPLLSSNILDKQSGQRVDWPNIPASTLVDVAGVRVGVIGVTTEETLTATIAANVADLKMMRIAEALTHESVRLRELGAQAVIVASHAGGKCESVDDPHDLSSCHPDQEIFEVARELPRGTVDAIVAGHTHRAVAHWVNDIAIIESHSYGQAFGRLDLSISPGEQRVVGIQIHPTRMMCGDAGHGTNCQPGEYEGAPVVPDDQVVATLKPFVEQAREKREQPLGVTLTGEFVEDRGRETALGNLFVDLMREVHDGDIVISNGGGIRTALPAGELTYGDFYELFPFDNRFAIAKVTGADIEDMFRRNLTADKSIMMVSGIRLIARCEGAEIAVTVETEDGRTIADDEELTVITTDFVATGGDSILGDVIDREGAIELLGGEPVREVLVGVLTSHGGELDPRDPLLFNPRRPRLMYPGDRPMDCTAPQE